MRKTLWPVRTSVCLSQESHEKACLLSEQRRISISDVIRTAVEKYLESNFPNVGI